MRSKLLLFVICFLMFQVVAKAQNQLYKEATVSHPAELWKAFNLANGTNVQDGVSFYVYNGECNSTKVKFLKIINTNNYAINFRYQLSEDSPVIIVPVQAAISIEGSCESIDKNLTNLVIILQPKKTEAENKAKKEFLLSHIEVSRN